MTRGTGELRGPADVRYRGARDHEGGPSGLPVRKSSHSHKQSVFGAELDTILAADTDVGLPDAYPLAVMQTIKYGNSASRVERELNLYRVVASVGDNAFLGLYGGSSMDPDRDLPQIELAVSATDKSPRIVLRDVHGQVIWHAP